MRYEIHSKYSSLRLDREIQRDTKRYREIQRDTERGKNKERQRDKKTDIGRDRETHRLP